MAPSSMDRIAAYGLLIALGSFAIGWIVSPSARQRPVNPDIVAVDPGNVPAGFAEAVDVAEKERIRGEREAEREQEAYERRLRSASRVVLQLKTLHPGHPYDVIEARELSDGRFAFAVHVPPYVIPGIENRTFGGVGEYFIVEAGNAVAIGEDRYEWETTSPGEIAARWASRAYPDGSFRTRKVTASSLPRPTLEAVVIDRNTGRSYRVRLIRMTPGGMVDFEVTPIDE